jgi:hypothetical protein
MNPEDLKQRLNEKAAAFLQQLFARLLIAELGSGSAVLNEYRDHFLRIRILVFTHFKFQIP